MDSPKHFANMTHKALRAVRAIDQIVDDLIARGVYADRLEGLRDIRRRLVVDNDPVTWALISERTKDREFRTSRPALFAHLELVIDQEAGLRRPLPDDPFEGLVA